MIEQADIIFWIGEDIETFMETLESIAKNAKKTFYGTCYIEKLKFREENIDMMITTIIIW